MSSSSDDISTCVVCGVSGIGLKLSNEKLVYICTSCALKVEHCTKDGVSDNTSRTISSDAVSDSLSRVDISDEDDNKLFQDPPPNEDCSLCMQPLPFATGICGVEKVYMTCCGKILCIGCSMAERCEMEKGNIKAWCAFCRVPHSKSNKESVKRIKKRMQVDDDLAFLDLGMQYRDGTMGLPQDMNKALELWAQSAELGSINAHDELARAYQNGKGVAKDMNKAKHHWKLAAIGGHERARHNLGTFEAKFGSMNIAIKHYMIAAKSGHDDSLKEVGKGYKAGYVTKDEYAKTLRAHKDCWDEMKSEQRTKALAVCRQLMS